MNHFLIPKGLNFVGSIIRRRMLMITITLVLIPLIIIIVVVNILFSSYIKANALGQLEYLNLKIEERFKSFNNSLDDLSIQIIINGEVQRSLNESITYTDAMNLTKYLNLFSSYPVDSIVYIDNKKNIYQTTFSGSNSADAILNSPIVKLLDNTYGKLVWSWQKDDIFGDYGQKHLFVARYVRHLDISLKPGILIMKINPDVFKSIINKSELMNDSRYLILDQSNIVTSSEYTGSVDRKNVTDIQIDKDISKFVSYRQPLVTGKIEKAIYKGNFILYLLDPDTLWKIVSISPFSAVEHEFTQLQKIMYVVAIIAVIGSIIVVFFYTNLFSEPINKIINGLRAFQKGNFETRLEFHSQDEFVEIADSFNQMASEINNLMKTIQKDQDELKAAELNSLIYQINPHFIYNTLDNIRMLSRLSGDKKTGQLIQALSNFLRITLSKGQSLIMLSEEFQHATNYLMIQQIRYEGLFAYEVNLETGVSRLKIIKFILQPLIENSIMHGFKNMNSEGKIQVSGCQKDDLIIIEVVDNGQGSNKEVIENLNSLLFRQSNDMKKISNDSIGGYGISNVAARLRLSYGTNVSMKFENLLEDGMKCTITVLKHLMQDEEV